MTDRPIVGFIGLGVMGRPMCLNLLRAGYPLLVHDLDPGKIQALVAAGASDGGSAQGVAQRAEVIITSLPDAPDVQAVIGGPGGVLEAIGPGKVIVDMSTSSPVVARQLAARAEALGAEMLDAPVSGGEIGATQGTLSIMVGGKPEVLERVRPVLGALGRTITHIGGAGQVCKACNQVVTGLTIEAVAEALVLAARSGVDPARVRQALLGGSAQSRVLDEHGGRMLARNWVPGFRARLHRKDLRIALSAAAEYGATLPVTGLVHELYSALVATGRGDLDNSAIVTILEALAGTEE